MLFRNGQPVTDGDRRILTSI